MDNLKDLFAKRLQKLRTDAGMTQSELGDKLSYSDKTVSKWERGEAIPDASVLKKLSGLFHVSVDSLLNTEKKQPEQDVAAQKVVNHSAIIRTAIVGVWTLAVLLFVIFWILGRLQWIIFAAAMPVSLVVLLVLNSVWKHGRGNFWIVSALFFSLLAVVYLFLLPLNNPWQLFLVGVPGELLIFCCFHIKKRKK